ncbi:MAG TPA: FAD-dependent oxidoreductase [Acidimicrobiales bacterium]|nr:FAD-dependent oxidoreductase [Acidimicrobiales bacterium]
MTSDDAPTWVPGGAVADEDHVDVAVVGGGAMGLATAWWAAGRGRVVVLDRFAAGHARGASHGTERIFRHAYPEAAYVEMALAAEEGWGRLERDTGRPLIRRVGCVEHGLGAPLDVLASVAADHGVATERLAPGAAGRRWPALRFATDVLAQPAAGWVHAADALAALAREAVARGAEVRTEVAVTALERRGDGTVRVRTGDTGLVAEVVVVAAGAWAADLLAPAGVTGLPPLVTTEEHVFFLRPGPGAGPVPAFIHWGDVARYGLPAANGLVKVGEHHTGAVTTGDARSFAADPARAARIERWAAEWLPGVVPEVVETTTCLYTTTPSHDFVLDRVGPIVVATGFSGHGFKFVPEVGRHLAGLATGTAEPRPPFTLAAHAAGNTPAEPGPASGA